MGFVPYICLRCMPVKYSSVNWVYITYYCLIFQMFVKMRHGKYSEVYIMQRTLF